MADDYSDMWVHPDQDPRNLEGPSGEGELANYRGYLTNYRLTLELKCQDLTPEKMTARSVPPSTLSLLGLVRHMAKVEHSWFQRGLQGRLDEPRPFFDAERADVDFDDLVPSQASVDEAFAAWREQISRADTWLDSQSDASMAEQIAYNSDGDVTSVRDILVHMIEEYARHCGHADLLRECIDGRTGQ